MTQDQLAALSDAELLPCPFCGGAAVLSGTFTPGVNTVRCKACGCAAGFGNDAEAIAAWNTRANHLAVIGPDAVEKVARAIATAKGITPDALYQHHEGEAWLVDDRQEYVDAFSDEKRVMLFHKAWRHSENLATAAIAALTGRV